MLPFLFSSLSDDVTGRLPEHRVHSQRPVPNTGLRSKQAVSMATAASGHASASVDVVVREE